MQRIRLVVLSLACLTVLAVAALNASDRVAVYARIDKVIFAPDAANPTTAQVFGVFSVANATNPNDYQAAGRGYLYFTLAGDEAQARREWNDLKEVAGTAQIVAFGERSKLKPRLRLDTEAPSAPDAYVIGTGVYKINGRTDYAPIRALAGIRH
jgi:hypothetical protein